MKTRDDIDEASLLLPWFVNGTLDETGKAHVARVLANSAALRAEADWLIALQGRLRASALQADPEAGWDRLRQIIAAERAGRVVSLPTRHAPRVMGTPSRWVPLALAATLLLGVFIGNVGLREPNDITPLSEHQAGAGHKLIQVTFKSSATEGEIRRLVHAVKAEIVSGPGALGVYTFRVPTAHARAALEALRARRDLVETAALVKP